MAFPAQDMMTPVLSTCYETTYGTAVRSGVQRGLFGTTFKLPASENLSIHS